MKIISPIMVMILICCNSGLLLGQNRTLQHRPYADRQLFKAGFSIGLHTQDLILTHTGYENEQGEVWFAEIPHYSPGLTVGIMGDLYLTEYLNLRALPALNLGGKKLLFREQESGEQFETALRNNYFTLPVQLKISGMRINNYKLYFLAGGYGSFELASKKNRPILLKSFDHGIEIGAGCNFYLPLFTLSPELKFSFGMANLLERNRSDLKDEELMKYTHALKRAKQRMITLIFHFE